MASIHTTFADRIASILSSERTPETNDITVDIVVDVGLANKVEASIYFLDQNKTELKYFFYKFPDEIKSVFATKARELNKTEANLLFNAVSTRLGCTPERNNPRRKCVTAHWEV